MAQSREGPLILGKSLSLLKIPTVEGPDLFIWIRWDLTQLQGLSLHSGFAPTLPGKLPSVTTSSIDAEAAVAPHDTFIKAGSSELEVISQSYSWRH